MKIKTIHITTILTVMLSLHSTISVASPKELVCVSSAKDEADRMAYIAKDYADQYDTLCDDIRERLNYSSNYRRYLRSLLEQELGKGHPAIPVPDFDEQYNAECKNAQEENRVYLERSKIFYAKAEKCKKSSFGWKRTYLFDTDGLKDTAKNKVELQRESCNGWRTGVYEVTLSATPSVITFIDKRDQGVFRDDQHIERFNINRRDLTAGQFTCELRDVDMSGNLL